MRLVTVPSVFTSRGREIRFVPHAPTVGELLDREVPPGTWRAILDGRSVDDDQVLDPGDELIAVRNPAGFLIPIIVFALISAAIGIGLGYLVGLLLGQPGRPNEPQGPRGSATYNWSGITNTYTNGSAIPITYGKHRVGGQVISLYRRNANAASTEVDLHMLICLGFGPITKIGQYTTDQDNLLAPNLPTGTHFNGIDANTFRDVRGYLRLGRKGQAKIGSDFFKVIQSYPVQITLKSSDSVEYEFHETSEGFQAVFDFPNGLYDQSSGFADATVIVEVEKAEDGGGFSAVPGSPFTFTEQIVTPFSRTIFLETEFSGTTHKLRFKRQTAESTSDALIQDKIRIGDVNEVLRDDRQGYDGFAIVAYVIRATDQLHGQTPIVTSLIEGMQVPQWDGVDPKQPTLTYGFSSNPAWIALDLLLSKTYGLGSFVTPADIDVEAFRDWANWSDEQLTYSEEEGEPLFVTDSTEGILPGTQIVTVTDTDADEFAALDYVKIQFEALNQITTKTALGDGRTRFTLLLPTVQGYPSGWELKKVKLSAAVTDTRHEFHGVFDGSVNAWDALMRIAQVGRAFPVKLGNKFSIRLEKEGDAVQHINEANMIDGTFEVQYIGSAEAVDIIEAQYLDAAADYDQAVEFAGGIPPGLTREPQRRNLALYGITNSRQARREAFYNLLANQLVRRRIKFEMALDGIAAEQGDLISVGSVLPNWSDWTGRVTGTPKEFVIPHELTLPVLKAGKFSVAMIRTKDDRAPAIVNVTTTPGTYAPGATITTAATDDQQIRDQLCTIGTATKVDRVYRITKMTLKSNLTVEIEAVQYAKEIYALQGWQLCVYSGSGCIAAGGCFYFIPWDCAPFCPSQQQSCLDIPDCFCCFNGDIDVTITGTAADCIVVHQISENGIIIEIETACTGSFCIDVVVDAEYCAVCQPRCNTCSDEPCPPSLCLDCFDSCQQCYTIC